MKFLITISLIFFTSHIILSQENKNAPAWVNTKEANKIYKKDYFILLENTDCKRSKDIAEIKEIKLPEYRKRLAANIHTRIDQKIKKEYSEQTSDQKYYYDERIDGEVLMDSKIDLINCSNETYFDKKNKKLYFIIFQNKKTLQLAYEKRIGSLLIELGGDVSQKFEYKTKAQLVLDKRKIDKKVRLISEKIKFFSFLTASSINTIKRFQVDLNRYKIKISNLTALINDKAFEDKFAAAQTHFNKKECKDSYTKCQELLIINGSEKKVLTLLEESKSCQVDKMVKEEKAEFSKDNWEKCMKIIDELTEFNLAYKRNSYYTKRKSDAFEKYINKKFQQIDNIIEVDINKAESILLSIKWYGLDPKNYKSRYNNFSNKINKITTKNLKLKFKNRMNKGEFREAYQIILNVSDNSQNRNVKKTTSKLNKKWTKKVKKDAKKKILFERPHLYSLKLNASLFSPTIDYKQLNNSNDILNSFNRNTNYLYPYYSIAFYRKFNIDTIFGSKNRDRSYSNLIGIKAGIQDVTNGIYIQGPKDTLFGINNNMNYEFQISSLLLRFLNLNYGLFLNKIDNYTGAFFTTTFGFKIPIWRLNLDMNLKYLSDYQAEHHFLMEGGISLNFNYIKQFVREDKVQLKLNIENYK